MRTTTPSRSFDGRRTLFIVCGGKKAFLYLAQGTIFEEIDDVHVDDPDHEDSQSIYEYDAVAERQKIRLKSDFATKVTVASDQAFKHYRPDAIFLFVPSYNKNLIISCLKKTMRKKLHRVLVGNYTDFSPVQLILALESYYTRSDEMAPQNPSTKKTWEKHALTHI